MTDIADKPLLSIVVPLYNEEPGLEELHRRVDAALSPTGIPIEIILVDDGSTDRSLDVIRRLAAGDPRVRYAALSRNFGHEIASTCGLLSASGGAAVLMDADLQDPPELIPALVEKWREGYEVVVACRRGGAPGTAARRAGLRLFHAAMRLFSRVPFHPRAGDFGLIDRKALEIFRAFPERNRLVRGLVAWAGFRVATVEFERGRRVSGRSSYAFSDLFRMARDGFFGFARVPFWPCTLCGAAAAAAGLLGLLWWCASALLGGRPAPGAVPLAWALVFLGGVQLFFLGLAGEFITRTHREAVGRPLFVVRESNIPGMAP